MERNSSKGQIWIGVALTVGAGIWLVASLGMSRAAVIRPSIFLLIGLGTTILEFYKYNQRKKKNGADDEILDS